MVSANLRLTGTERSILACNFDERRRLASAAACQVLELLVPHFQRALNFHATLATARQTEQELLHALDLTPVGIVLEDAIDTPAVELDIDFSGFCNEDITIDRGKLTITGNGGTISGDVDIADTGDLVTLTDVDVDGGTVTIGGASRVVALRLSVTGAAENGIQLYQANLQCVDCQSTNNQGIGLIADLGASLVLAGTNGFSDNGSYGLFASGNAAITTVLNPLERGASSTLNLIETDRNDFGVLLTASASLTTYEGPNAQAKMSARDNNIGIFTGTGAVSFLRGNVDISGSGVLGLGVFAGRTFVEGTVTSTNGNIGVMLNENATLRGDARATDAIDSSLNQIGLLNRASYASIDNLILQNNANLAALIQFGAKLSVNNNNTSGFVACDGTELLRGSFLCGPN